MNWKGLLGIAGALLTLATSLADNADKVKSEYHKMKGNENSDKEKEGE